MDSSRSTHLRIQGIVPHDSFWGHLAVDNLRDRRSLVPSFLEVEELQETLETSEPKVKVGSSAGGGKQKNNGEEIHVNI